jgi:Holliday junction resolvase RusA-like endonuclease
MIKGRISKIPNCLKVKLDGSIAVFSDLITVKTGKINKTETIKMIKTNLESWIKNPLFNEFRNEKLDLAVIAIVNKQRMKKQDVDNVLKVVLDALKKNDKLNFKKDAFLFYDDSQIVRVLVQKVERVEDLNYETDQLVISFRKHNPNKQMILV